MSKPKDVDTSKKAHSDTDLDLRVDVAPEARGPPAVPELGPQAGLGRPVRVRQDVIAGAAVGVARQGAEN